MIQKYAEGYSGIDSKQLKMIADELGITGQDLVISLSLICVNAYKEIDRLEDENRALKARNSLLEQTDNIKQKDLVKAGLKPAYKSSATIEKIRQLEAQGCSDADIRRILNISQSTLWRRRNPTTALNTVNGGHQHGDVSW